MVLDPANAVAAVDERLFGSFIEHMGRAIYGGIFEPGHPTSDAAGWRHDVIDLVRELGVTTVRYPGGNFVSGYDWEDGVGPRNQRPTRLDRAWRSIEPNVVGTDDFMDWARLAGVTPMLAVNLGTRGAEAARNLVAYCNGRAGTPHADLRIANGHPEPHDVRLWCLGNEMDGPWQIGHKTAAEYGALATDAGRAMREVDPTIELVVCGSSGSQVPTFGAWEETVLDLAWDVADYVSVHAYYDPDSFSSVDAYLACSLDLGRTIEAVASIADSVGRRRGSSKRIDLSVDEWNVWRLGQHEATERERTSFRAAPPLAEDRQDLADALAVGCLLITLLRHADRVRIACLAQLVNVIPVIRTVDGGPAWRQTTFYPFADVARLGRGTVLSARVDSPTYGADGEVDVDAVELVAVHDPLAGALTIFAVNRTARTVSLDAVMRDLPGLSVMGHRVLTDADHNAANTAEQPNRVRPVAGSGARLDRDTLHVMLPARSWNVVHLGGKAAIATGD